MKKILSKFKYNVLSSIEQAQIYGGRMVAIWCEDGTTMTCRGTSCQGDDGNPGSTVGWCECDNYESFNVCPPIF